MPTQNHKLFKPLENWYKNIFINLKFSKIKIDNNKTNSAIPSHDIPQTKIDDGHLALYGWKIVIQETRKILEDLIEDVVTPNMQIIYYPSNGYMNWHTNSNNQSIRIYLVRSTMQPESKMKFKNKIIDDKPLWSYNIFKITQDTWHCIDAKTERLSLGFHYKGNQDMHQLKQRFIEQGV